MSVANIRVFNDKLNYVKENDNILMEAHKNQPELELIEDSMISTLSNPVIEKLYY